MRIGSQRPDIGIRAIYDASYSPGELDYELFHELLVHVSQEFGISAGLLRPSDRFDVELAPEPGNEWDSGVAALMLDVKRFAKRKRIALDREIVTLDDYLRFMSGVYE